MSGVLSLASWTIAFFFLKESNKQVLKRQQKEHEQYESKPSPHKKRIQKLDKEVSKDTLLSEEEHKENEERAKEEQLDDGASGIHKTGEGRGALKRVWSAMRILWTGEKDTKYAHIDVEMREMEDGFGELYTKKPPESIVSTPSKNGEEKEEKEEAKIEKEEEKAETEEEKLVQEEKEKEEVEEKEEGAKSSLITILKNRAVVVCIMLLSLSSLCIVAVDELFPLWAMNEPPVGVSMLSPSSTLCCTI